MKAITDFLTTHPLIAIAPLERAAGCPGLTIQHAMQGSKPSIPEKWAWNIIRELCSYGFEVRGWDFTHDAEIDAFFVEKRLDREPVIHEVFNKKKSSSHFEYQIWYYRDIISDDIELIQFLNPQQNSNG